MTAWRGTYGDFHKGDGFARPVVDALVRQRSPTAASEVAPWVAPWKSEKTSGLRHFCCNPLISLAEWTGLEPATPGVTGRYSNQLNYHSMWLPKHCRASQVPQKLGVP